MRRTPPLPLAALLIAALAACTGGGVDDGAVEDGTVAEPAAAADEAAADEPAEEAADPPDERPDVRQGTIRIEGMLEPATYYLYESPDDFPLAFSTYVPERMEVETLSEDGGTAIRFRADFGGGRDTLAYLQIFVYPEGTRFTRARSLAKSWVAALGLAVSRGIEPYDAERPKRWDWSLVEYDFRHQIGDRDPGDWLVGTIAVGEYRDRYFHMIVHYPIEYGDGFGPRVHAIPESWRWEATGTGL